MVIDIHAHDHPRAYNRAVSSFAENGGRPSDGGKGTHPDTDGEAHLQTRMAQMAQAGVAGGMPAQAVPGYPAGGRLTGPGAAVTRARG